MDKNPGAGNESRTRDLNLGKVALYQLSYSRVSYQAKPCILVPIQVSVKSAWRSFWHLRDGVSAGLESHLGGMPPARKALDRPSISVRPPMQGGEF